MEFFDYCKKANQMQKEYEENVLNSKNFWTMYQFILNFNFCSLPLKYGEIDLQELKENVIYKSKEILEGVDLHIRWIEEEKANILMKNNVLFCQKSIVEKAHDGTIFDIPLEPVMNRTSQIWMYHNQLADFKTFIYEKINISLRYDFDIIETRYFHELGYALIDRNVYSYYIYLLREYIPICMEIFYAYNDLENKLSYQKNHFNRIMSCKRNKEAFNSREDKGKRYVIGYLLAIITFEVYLSFSKKQRGEMRTDFVQVLNGEESVENFLGHYDIHFEREDSIKMLKKTMERIHS